MSPSAAVGVLHCSSNASSVVGLACHARRSHSRRCRYSAILQNGLTEESRNRYYAFLKSKNRSKAAVDKVCETEYLPFQVCQEEFRSLRSCSCSSFFLFSIHLFLRISLLNEFVWETCSCCCAQYQQDYLLVKEANRTSLVESIQNFLNVTERQGGFQSAPAGGESATPIASGQSSSIDSSTSTSTSTSTTTTTSTSTSTTVSTNNDGNVSALALACATERKYIKKGKEAALLTASAPPSWIAQGLRAPSHQAVRIVGLEQLSDAWNEALQQLLTRGQVIVSTKKLSPEEAQRAVDFISGAAAVIGATCHEVNEGCYHFATFNK